MIKGDRYLFLIQFDTAAMMHPVFHLQCRTHPVNEHIVYRHSRIAFLHLFKPKRKTGNNTEIKHKLIYCHSCNQLIDQECIAGDITHKIQQNSQCIHQHIGTVIPCANTGNQTVYMFKFVIDPVLQLIQTNILACRCIVCNLIQVARFNQIAVQLRAV